MSAAPTAEAVNRVAVRAREAAHGAAAKRSRRAVALTGNGLAVRPGGRITPGEYFNEALIREIKEETGLEVTIGRPFYVGEWRRTVRSEDWQIIGVFLECFAKTDKVILSDDHNDYVWISPADYQKYNIMEATIPAFKAYLEK